MKKNQIVFCEIYGRMERCKVLAIHDRYTIDVERMNDGRCFRVSNLNILEN
jgi:hypothetical protein